MPSVHQVHPEFGYFCPTPRLRRDVRVAIVSIVLGTIVGAAWVTLRAAHDRDTESALAMTHVAHSSVDSDAASSTKVEAIKVDRMRIETAKPDAAKSEKGNADIAIGDSTKSQGAKIDNAKIASTKVDSAKAESAKTDGRSTDGAKTDPLKTACDDNTAYLDGTCLAPKPRRVRVRVATDSPAVARAPIGRSSSPGVSAPAVAAATTPNAAQSAAAQSSPATSSAATATQPDAQPAVAPKKQKIARSHPRHRNDSAHDARNPNSRGMVATNAGGPFGGGFFGMRMQWPW
jgi:hypothetical protein